MKENLLKIIVIVIGLYLVFVLSRSLWDLKNAGGRLGEAQERYFEAKKENENLKKRLIEVNSIEFIEKEAREKLNLQRSGEVVLILPPQEAKEDSSTLGNNKNEKNWEKWWKLFF